MGRHGRPAAMWVVAGLAGCADGFAQEALIAELHARLVRLEGRLAAPPRRR